MADEDIGVFSVLLVESVHVLDDDLHLYGVLGVSELVELVD